MSIHSSASQMLLAKSWKNWCEVWVRYTKRITWYMYITQTPVEIFISERKAWLQMKCQAVSVQVPSYIKSPNTECVNILNLADHINKHSWIILCYLEPLKLAYYLSLVIAEFTEKRETKRRFLKKDKNTRIKRRIHGLK
jgi:hypothetical protein